MTRPLLLALSLALVACGDDSAGAGSDPASAAATGLSTASWASFATSSLVPGWQLQVDHPPQVDVNEIDGGVTLRYVGPGSPPASEITDGYLVSITPVADGGLDQLTTREGGAAVDTIEWGGGSALSWTTLSELDGSRIPHLGVPAGVAGSPVALDIAIHISGDDEGRYHEEVDRILSTLSWTQTGP